MKCDRKRYSRMLLILLAVSMLAGLLTACGSKKDEKTTFVVGFDAEFPPYGFKDEDGNYTGFDLELAEEVCRRRGWELVKQPIDWEQKNMELNSGAIDCIWNGFTVDGREEDYTWTTAYVDNSQVVVVRKNSDINSLSDLKGKVVCVQSDSAALAALTGEDASPENIELCESFKELVQISNYVSAFLDLDAGSVDAICIDVGVAYYQLNQNPNFKLLKETVSSEKYGVAFKYGNTALRNQVQETLEEMYSDGTMQEIASHWKDYYIAESLCFMDEGTDFAYRADDTSKKDEPFGKKFVSISKQLGKGILSSLSIFFLTLIFSMPLGLLLTFIRMSRLKVLQWVARIYISIMRGTPLMLQLLVVFYGPHFLFGADTSQSYRFYAVIIGFSLNYAAYFAEIYRSGIEGIPAGQREAADVLGYSKGQTFRKIIFPQMCKRVIPPVTNEVITLVKDTSLAFALAYTEMFTLAKQITASEASILPLFIAGIFYYIFNFIVAMVMEAIEKKMKYY
ncbi:MAG: ABC transporter permease subunit [Eubacterium sp.]|nr:ABC transporter permease subunit [Eubacterium sp.]SEG35507.1 polar amino acid transport system substrate-binding protein [Eubacterium ruminantium]